MAHSTKIRYIVVIVLTFLIIVGFSAFLCSVLNLTVDFGLFVFAGFLLFGGAALGAMVTLFGAANNLFGGNGE